MNSKKEEKKVQEQDNILEMRQIDKLFPGVKALDKVDFSVKR